MCRAVPAGESPEGGITVSIDAATLDTDRANPEALIAAVDSALYHGKRHGRNCVHHAGRLALGATGA
jgi:PleD family two-component response regulator